MSDEATSQLKPAPMEQGGERKLWFGIRVLCAGEAWSILFGSGILWYLGLVHSRSLLYALASGGVGVWLVGSSVETWLAMLSREPLLNDRDEIDSIAPTERSLRYVFPPLIATFGVIGAAVNMAVISVITSVISLALFAWMLRRILRIWRNRSMIADS